MTIKRAIILTEDVLLKAGQIVMDRDKDGVMEFVRDVVKKQIG